MRLEKYIIMTAAEIFIQMKDPFIYSGDQLNGMVHVKVNRVVEIATLMVNLKGEEKSKLVKKDVTYYTNSKGQRQSRTRYYTKTDSKIFLDQEILVYRGTLSPGVFSFPISKTSSQSWPGTFQHYFKMFGYDCFAIVDFTISARLSDGSQSSSPAFISSPLYVVQSPSQVNLDMANSKEDKKVIKGCDCDCCLRGDLHIKATFTKVFYKQNDVAVVYVDIDNSKCKVDLTEFRCYFAQKFHYKAQFESYTPKAVHFARDGGKIKAGEVKRGVKFEIPIAHEKAGLLYPSFKGELISNSYVLEASAETDTCCSSPLTVSFDIKLVPQDALLSKWKIEEPRFNIPTDYQHHMMPAAFLQAYPSEIAHAKVDAQLPPGFAMSPPMPYSSEYQATPIAQPREVQQVDRQTSQ
jgi:hypothetical protein